MEAGAGKSQGARAMRNIILHWKRNRRFGTAAFEHRSAAATLSRYPDKGYGLEATGRAYTHLLNSWASISCLTSLKDQRAGA
jgi:hypothetical protein